MNCNRPTYLQHEQRGISSDLAADTAQLAATVHDQGRDLTRQQREALRRLVVAARVISATLMPQSMEAVA